MNNNLQGIDFSNLAMPVMPDISKAMSINNNILKEVNRQNVEKIYIEKKQIELLEDIKSNTSGISEMIVLLKNNNDIQEELLDIHKELFQIATIKDQEKATSEYRRVMDKIKLTISDTKAMSTLLNFGINIGNILVTLGIISKI